MLQNRAKRTFNEIKHLIKDGFFHILGAGTINKVISLCSSLFIVRVMTKADYGMYGYVINIVSIVLLANGLGTITGMLQFGCMAGKDTKKRNSIFNYGMRIGLITNLIIAFLIIGYAIIMPEKIEGSREYLIFAAGIPIFRYLVDCIPTYLKVANRNKTYGRLTSFNSIVILISMLSLAYFFRVYGVLSARYITNAITIIIGIFILKEFKITRTVDKSIFPVTERKEFLKFSLITCVDNTFSQLLYNIDVFVIGIVIGDTISIASYKAATTIPFALSFISSTIIVYVYPMFVENKDDKKWLKSHYKKLVMILGAINGVIAIFAFCFAPFIIRIVFGEAYLDSVTCFRILIAGYWIASTFRIPGGNVLSMTLHAKENMIIAIASGLFNIFLDVILIKNMGSIGAAIATTSIYILTAVASNYVLYRDIKKGEKA